MTDPHADGDLLLALALDDVSEAEREAALQHLSGCAQCRSEYDALSSTIERTLAAAPSVEPSPGFDRRVLDAMGFTEPAPTTPAATAPGTSAAAAGPRPEPARGAPRPRPARWQLVAASVAVGLGLGAGTTYALTRDTAPEAPVAAHSSYLTTRDGAHVGTVTRSYAQGRPVLVVTVDSGRVGMAYRCQVRLADGSTVPVGDWTIDAAHGETWVVDAPTGNVTTLELVANDGAGPVWSSARL